MASTFLRVRLFADSLSVTRCRASQGPTICRHIHYTPSCSRAFRKRRSKPWSQVLKEQLDYVKKVEKSVSREEPPEDVQTMDAFCTIQAAGLKPSDNPVMSNTGSQVVCAYTWSKVKRPTIKIPGFPRVWSNLAPPRILLPHPNIDPIRSLPRPARQIQYPFQALFRAVEIMNPKSEFETVDVVVNRDSLILLLGLCGGAPRKSFRLDMSMVQNTLFIEPAKMTASEVEAYENMPNPNDWGQAFKTKFTEPPKGLEHTAESFRAIKYVLGGLNCVVQFEVDAFYGTPKSRKERIKKRRFQKDVSIKVDSPPIIEDHYGDVLLSGVIKHDAIAEMMASTNSRAPNSLLPMMWFGRTQWLIRGYYKKETLSKVDTKNLEDRVLSWEVQRQKDLRKMVSLLSQLREAVRESGAKRCIATHDENAEPQELKVTISSKERGPLPDDLIQRFWPDGSDQSLARQRIHPQQQRSEPSEDATPHSEPA